MTVAGRLGSSDYAAQITERGGGQTLGEMPWDTITYNRVSDDTGDAKTEWAQGPVSIPPWVMDVEPWEHDLVIWRTQEPAEPVFVGPVRNVNYVNDAVTVTAKDGTAWFERRRIGIDHTYDDIDLAYIFGAYAQLALAQDPSPNLQIITAACGIKGTRVSRAIERANAMDLMRELSRSGVDWTVVARRILIGGADLTDALGVLVLIDEAVKNAGLVKAGDSTTTQETIRWQTADKQEPMLKTVRSNQADTLGLLESLDEEPDIADTTSAGAAAQSRLDLRSRNPRVISCDLTGDAPTTISQLIPGRKTDFRLSTLPIGTPGITRLSRVAVTVNQTGETVTINTTPLGVEA